MDQHVRLALWPCHQNRCGRSHRTQYVTCYVYFFRNQRSPETVHELLTMDGLQTLIYKVESVYVCLFVCSLFLMHGHRFEQICTKYDTCYALQYIQSRGLASAARARGLALRAPGNLELAGDRRNRSSAVCARVERYQRWQFHKMSHYFTGSALHLTIK